MDGWYLYTLFALMAFGLQRFLYKVSAERKCNTAWTTFTFMGTVTVLSTFFFFSLDETVTGISFLIVISLINSISFLCGTITTIEALKYVSTSIAYPLIRLNTAIVVIFSIIYFKDNPSMYQIAGILLAITVICLLTRHNGDDDQQNTLKKNTKVGFTLVFVALFSGAFAAISSKFAATHTNLLGFMALSYAMSTIFSFTLRNRLQGREENPNHGDAIAIGVIMGVVNFMGFYSLLKALSVGPLSLIISMTGLYFAVAIMLSALIYKERLTTVRITGIAMTIVSITLMRL